MSNIVLDAVLVSGNAYSLTSLPSSLSKAWELIPSITLKDEFVYIESIQNTVNGQFRHVRTGIICNLSTNLFLDHERYYYPTNEKNAVKKALYICSDSLLYPFGSTLRSLRQPVKAGTIFTSYHVEGNFYVVTDNTGNRLRAYKNIARPIVDIEDSNTNKSVISPKEPLIVNTTQPVVIEPVDEVGTILPIEVVASYSVLGYSFTNIGDAEFIAHILKEVTQHKFADVTSIETFKQMIQNAFQSDVSMTQS